MLRTILLWVVTCAWSHAQAQVFQWAKPIHSNAARGMAVAVDDDGNSYVCGNVAGTVDFDPGSGTAIDEVNAGTSNVFLMKYDVNGEYLWHVALSNTGGAIAKCLGIDSNGDVVMAGRYEASITFGPGTAGTITSNGSMDCFIAKYSANGDLIWVRSFGAAMGDEVHGLALDAADNIIVSGFFSNTVDFDPGPGTTTLINQGGFDGFVAKYAPTGAFQWVRGVQGAGSARMWSVAVDPSGDIHALGHFTGSVTVAGLSPVTSNGLTDGLLCRFNADGTALWRQPFGGTGNVTTERVVNDGAGHLYVMGSFSGIANIDPGGGNVAVTSVGNNNVFFAKLLTNGNALWGHGIRAVNHFDGVGDIAVDAEGHVYVTSAHNQEIDLDTGPGEFILPAPAGTGHDLFLAKYDAGGGFLFARAIATEGGFDTANMMAVDEDGGVWVTGSFGQSVLFDADAPGGTLDHTSSHVGFTAKYGADLGTSATATRHSTVDIRLFPNPVSDQLHVLLADGRAPQSWELIDATGGVLRHHMSPITGPINVGALVPGLYRLRLLVDGSWQVRSFVVLRQGAALH